MSMPVLGLVNNNGLNMYPLLPNYKPLYSFKNFFDSPLSHMNFAT